MKIKMLKTLQTKSKQLIAQGEEFQARRIPEKFTLLDTKTPFQIIEGPFAGEEIPFKLAVILPDEPRPTQRQYDELKRMSEEALTKATASQKILNEISAVVGEHDGSLVDAVLQLVQDKAELLQTIERYTDEQLNSEKLLQRIREMETIAQGRDEMIKSLRSELEDVRSTLKPVELPYATVKAMNIYFKNDRRREEKAVALLNILSSPARELTSPARHIKEYFNGDSLRLAESVVLGYSVAEEQDELSEEIDRLTEKWFQEILKSGSDIETTRQDLNKVIYEFMRGLDKTAV